MHAYIIQENNLTLSVRHQLHRENEYEASTSRGAPHHSSIHLFISVKKAVDRPHRLQ